MNNYFESIFTFIKQKSEYSPDMLKDVKITKQIFELPIGEKEANMYEYKRIHEYPEINSLLDNAENIYVTADYHLTKPKRIQQQVKEKIIMNHNAIVKSNDVVIILGDLINPELPMSNKELKDFINSLNGIKILVIGNNDNLLASKYKKLGFTYAVTSFKYRDMIFTHFPYETNLINIHGHIHEAPFYFNVKFNKHKNAYIDTNDFKPYRLEDLLNKEFNGTTIYGK